MNNNQRRYKKQGVGFTNTNTGRLLRTVKHEERRRANRAETFDKHRGVSEAQQIEESSSSPSNITRKLRRWQAERNIKRKIEAQKKRPAFKVGVVHHKYYSPPVSDKIRVEAVPCHRKGVQKKKHNPTPEKRITRATQKRLEAKLAGLSVTPAKPFNSKLKAKAGKIVKKRLPSLTRQATHSFAPDNYSFKAPAGLEEIPLFGRFVIPNTDKDFTKNISEFDLKAEEEKPWPPANIPTLNIMTTENLQNSDSLKVSTHKSATNESITSATTSPVEPKANRRKNSRKRSSSHPEISIGLENHPLETTTRLEKTLPLFGRFVVPSQIKDGDALAENSIESNEQKPKPSPRENLASDDKTTSQKMQASGSFESSSQENSSIESVTLRISFEDESPEENVALENPVDSIDKPDFPEDEDEIDVPLETTTPPRSGTPVPASFSPYIVSSRGKSSARKEQRIKMGVYRSSPDEIPTKETVMQNLNISAEDEERTAQYFKFLLQREIDRLTEWCAKWEAIMEEPDITEDVKYMINQAVGQTRLLMRKKFERFRRLVLDCETGKGEMLVQCSDLQGFWDMIHMEIKDCETRFLKLEFLKSKDWIEDQIVVDEKKVTKKKVVKPKPKIKAKSSARSWILAARKKKIAEEGNIDDDEIVIGEKCPETQHSESKKLMSLGKSPSRDGENRRRSAIVKTPNSLLKQLQLSEISKSVISPLAVMKISKMCKTPKVKLDDSISYVNSDQTPGKGILKKTEESRELSANKAERKVDFDYVFLGQVAAEDEVDDPLQNSINLGKALARIDSLDENTFIDVSSEEDAEDEVKETLQNSIDLGRALARIDDYDEDDDMDVKCGLMQNVTVRGAEKRLDFEDDWFNDIENTNIPESAAIIGEKAQSMEIPDSSNVSITPTKSALKESQSSPKSSKKSLPRSSKFLEMSIEENKSENIRNSSRRRSRRVNQIPETPVEENEPENSKKSSKRVTRRTSKILQVPIEEDETEKITNSNRRHSRLANKDFETPVEVNKPQQTLHSSRKPSRRTSKVPEATIEENDVEITSIGNRVLRNRTIAAETPSSKNRKSLSSSVNEKHDISIDLSKKENSNPQQRWKETNSESCDVVTEKPATENETKRRKSTRKSVRFNADDCMACTPKSTLPKTPRRQKSGKISLLGESLRQSIVPLSGGDLMAFDTP